MIKEIETASPLVAAFIRGFMEHADEDTSLRNCGQAGKDDAEELGFSLSPTYLSKITKNMVKWGVIIKKRNGKHYEVARGEHFDEVRKWIEDNPDWGLSKFTPGDFRDRNKAFDLMNNKLGVVFDNDRMRIPRGAWAVLQAAFKKDELKCVYVPNDAVVVMVRRDEEGNRVQTRLRSWDQTEVADR